jgi:hypothetical protein
MNFFRLRVLNTFLLFLIGIVAGFILKDRFYPQTPAAQPYSPSYKSSYEAAGGPQAADEETAAEEEPAEEPAPEPAPRRRADTSAERAEEPAGGEDHIVIEPAPAAPAKREVLRGRIDAFFLKPAEYAGRELEMDLQMITAKRSGAGWRLNFVHTGPDKRIDYLYAEDASGLLGGKPDLRIGYVYTVRFLCEKGETADGNTLLSLTPTGEKADWATGLSAVE